MNQLRHLHLHFPLNMLKNYLIIGLNGFIWKYNLSLIYINANSTKKYVCKSRVLRTAK